MLGVLQGWGQWELFLCDSQPHKEEEEEEEEGAPHYWDAAMWGRANIANHRMDEAPTPKYLCSSK